MPTILHRLSRWAKENPQAPAQRTKQGKEWKVITAREYARRVYHLALFLQSRKITPKDTGIIFSVNCPEWVHMDLATVLIGTKSAGLYPNSNPKDIQYILGQTQAAVLSVQNKAFWLKITDNGAQALPDHVRVVIVFDDDTSYITIAGAKGSPEVITYKSALAEGRELAKSVGKTKFSELLEKADPDAGLFMIYTSGTTGNPKGALLSLDNISYATDIAVDFWRLPYGRGSLISFLPLCHVAEKMQNLGVGITQRFAVSFATKIENVSKELPEVEPTLLFTVPRLWEKMMEGVLLKVENSSPVQKKLALWALEVGRRVAEARYSGRFPNPVDLVQYKIADRLVLSKIRKAMGLAKAERLASGAAVLPVNVARWFRCIGVEILEAYGQTESAGIICLAEVGVDCVGTVGRPPPGIEFKLAEDGEILTRGRHVFKGYFKDEAATAKTVVDGWLHTGDLGTKTDKGLIKIVGRKKEIMKTSGGKMIAPVPIEEAIKSTPNAASVLSQICVVGDGRKYLTALVTLTEQKILQLKERKVDMDGTVIESEVVVSEVKSYFDQVNKTLSSYEQIKRFAILSREFSVEKGEMTPTLKIKRAVVESRYREVIDEMYGASD